MSAFDTVVKYVHGLVAHDAVDSGNPIKTGGKASSSLPTAVSSGDRVDAYFDVNGRQIVRTYAPPYTTPTHTGVNAATSSGTALASNSNRLYALIINDSDTVVYLALGATAVANTGIRINGGGGAYEMSSYLGNLYTGAINCIHDGSGSKVLLVTEGV